MLFNKRLLQTHLNSFEYPHGYDFERTQKIIGNWQKAIRDGNYDKTKETQVQSSFLNLFFNVILGYGEMHDNSLIDDETIVGNKAFNWNEQFEEIMNNDGFDCIIGNPPYVFTRAQEYEENMKLYFQNYLCSNSIIKEQKGKNIQSGKLNLYTWFIIKSIELLKDGGVLGFIIPNGILRTTTYDLVRKFILDNTKILQIVDMGAGVFEGVTASTVILILEKNNNTDCCHNNDINVITNVENLLLKQFTSYKIKQLDFLNNTSYAFNIFVDSYKQNVNEKINNNAVYLGEICKYISPGIDGDQEKYVSKIKETEKYKPLLYGKNIGKYSIHGKCLFPDDQPIWWNDFEQELLRFPQVQHDDQCDALSQALNYPDTVSILNVL